MLRGAIYHDVRRRRTRPPARRTRRGARAYVRGAPRPKHLRRKQATAARRDWRASADAGAARRSGARRRRTPKSRRTTPVRTVFAARRRLRRACAIPRPCGAGVVRRRSGRSAPPRCAHASRSWWRTHGCTPSTAPTRWSRRTACAATPASRCSRTETRRPGDVLSCLRRPVSSQPLTLPTMFSCFSNRGRAFFRRRFLAIGGDAFTPSSGGRS
jgi:hypothetical protein